MSYNIAMIQGKEYTLWTIPAESSEEQDALKVFVENMENRGLNVAEATPRGVGWWQSDYPGNITLVNLDELIAKINIGEVVIEGVLKVVNYRSSDAKDPSMFPSVVYVAEKNKA